MYTTSNNLSVLYVLKKHRHHINDTTTPPTLLYLASMSKAGHSKIDSYRNYLRVGTCSSIGWSTICQLVRNKKRKEYNSHINLRSRKKIGPFYSNVPQYSYLVWYFTRFAKFSSSWLHNVDF